MGTIRNIANSILLACALTSCATTNTDPLVEKNILVSSLLGKSEKDISEILEIVLEDEFGYMYKGEKYFGSSYGPYVFLFSENALINVVSSSETDWIWQKNSLQGEKLPYVSELPDIHNKLTNLPTYTLPPQSPLKLLDGTQQPGSDQAAAVTMMVLSLPLLPSILGEKYQADRARDLDWINFSLDSELSEVSELLGKAYKRKQFEGNIEVVGYSNPKSQYRTVTNYVGIKGGRVIWALKSNPYILE